MNATTRTALRVLLATPLAAAALTVGGVAGGVAGVAHADGEPTDPGTIVLPLPGGDPEPQPHPHGPGDKDGPNPTDDQGDKDGPNQDDDPRPEGPGEFAAPGPVDQPDVPGDGSQDDTVDEKKHHGKADQPRVAAASADVPVPTRIDAGEGSAQEEGLQLAWLLVGGGAVTAAGSVLAGRRPARSRR